jgi:predicted Zn-dependent peptidase
VVALHVVPVIGKRTKLFSNIECYHLGSTDAGLLTIEGKLVKGVTMEATEATIEAEIKKLQATGISERELEKVKNKTESMMAFEDMSVVNGAASLAMYELLGDADLINKELDRYRAVTATELMEECNIVFNENNSNTLQLLCQ